MHCAIFGLSIWAIQPYDKCVVSIVQNVPDSNYAKIRSGSGKDIYYVIVGGDGKEAWGGNEHIYDDGANVCAFALCVIFIFSFAFILKQKW